MTFFSPYHRGGGVVSMPNSALSPQSPGFLLAGYHPPTTPQAITALTPNLYRAVCECRLIYGATDEANLVNFLAMASFAASGNFRIRGHNGKSMPLILDMRFVGPPLSGKSEARDRSIAPVEEGMKGWKYPWLFNNITPAALLRKIRRGSVLAMLSTTEGRGHLSDRVDGQLSREFHALNELYDGHIPSFDRADDDDDELVAKSLDSAIFVRDVNVQHDKNQEWLDKYGQDAVGAGSLYRILMMETNQIAMEGAGKLRPEMALLDYDQRIVELIASARHTLASTSVRQLPVIEVSLEAEQILRCAVERFTQIASAVLSQQDARVFAVRLAANTRRIAGCMHVYERYQGAVSADTMMRAVTIAECFGAHWLRIVLPPKPIPESVLRARQLFDYLNFLARESGWKIFGWRKSDIEMQAPNFGWTKAQMTEAITAICGQGVARVVACIENGRRVINLELVTIPVPVQSDQKSDSPKN